MSTIVELPNSHNVWSVIRSGYRDYMQQEGIPADKIAVILDELRLFHDRIHSDQRIEFKLKSGTQYSQLQLQEIKEAAEQLTEDFGNYVQERIGAAHGLILHLLVEKHAGGWPNR